jgi:hypothetical protein
LTDSGVREALQEQQFAVVEALTKTGRPPDGFNARKFQVAADSLLHKRARSLARAWPALARFLGSEFMDRFRAYASQVTSPPRGGPVVDGRQFAAFLSSRKMATPELREAMLLFDARYRIRSGLARERRLAIKFTTLRSPIRLILVIKVPVAGVRIFTVPPHGRRRRSGA